MYVLIDSRYIGVFLVAKQLDKKRSRSTFPNPEAIVSSPTYSRDISRPNIKATHELLHHWLC